MKLIIIVLIYGVIENVIEKVHLKNEQPFFLTYHNHNTYCSSPTETVTLT